MTVPCNIELISTACPTLNTPLHAQYKVLRHGMYYENVVLYDTRFWRSKRRKNSCQYSHQAQKQLNLASPGPTYPV